MAYHFNRKMPGFRILEDSKEGSFADLQKQNLSESYFFPPETSRKLLLQDLMI